ncbi:MAG: hypothetical protein ACRC6R_07420 [Bacteroidales bacterium]
MKIRVNLKKVVERINSVLKNNKPIIDTIGVFVGVGMVLLTWNTIRITQKTLDLSLKQYSDRQVPVWDWETSDTLSMVTLRSTTTEIRVQVAQANFPQPLFESFSSIVLSQPDFNLNLSLFREKITQLYMNSANYDPSRPTTLYGNLFPFGLEVNYIQYGEARSVRGIFGIQYTIVQEQQIPHIVINGVIFQNYIDTNQNLTKEVDKLYRDYYE